MADGTYRVAVKCQQVDVSEGQEYLFTEYRYRFVITNISRSQMDAAEVFCFAYGRCDQENIIEQFKNGIAAMRTSTAELLANSTFLMAGQLAWCLRSWLSALAELMCYSLETVRTYLLEESFQALWEYKSYHWAGVFLDAWLKRAMRSRLEPIKKVARSIRAHQDLILNWFAAQKEFSSGMVEGLNYRIKRTIRKAYGFRTLEAAEIALYHALGSLPEPELAHEFC